MKRKEKVIEFLSQSAGKKMRDKWITVLVAPVMLLSTVSGLFVLFYLFERWLPLPRIPGSPIILILATPLVIFGLAGMLISVFQFLRVKGSPIPMHPPPTLVTNGLYGIIRNPMFCGLFLFLWGLGIWLQSILIVFVFVPALIVLVRWEIKVIEEPELEKRLGQAYRDYRVATPMFFPRLTREKRP